LNLPRSSRLASVISVIAVVGLLAGGLTSTEIAARGPGGGTLLADAGRWDQPFLRAEPTDVAKGALRERRDLKNPIGKKFTALFSAPPLSRSTLSELTSAPLRAGLHPPLPSLTSRSPRGPPI
jgi:hypothetical protein